MKVIVIGGGIGGLSAALHLLRAGIDVQVYEQAPQISEIGAGIQISPNASRLLHRLGLRPAMDKVGVFPQAVHQRRWDDGRTLQRAPIGRLVEETFGAPYYHFHRADLAHLLAGALPAGRVNTSHRLVGIEEKAGSVVAVFENGARAEADVLVGADGIHSKVNALVFGAEKPRFTGCVAWRGLVPAEKVRHLDIEVASHNWMGPDGHVVHYWVSGGRFMNVVCVTEQGAWTEEGWTVPGNLADVAARYADWHPTVRALISAFPETFVWALHDRTELPRWSRGRITLLGDACHPMLPFMAQGAAQAIEDGAALAAVLAMSPGAPEQALKRYEEVRKPRATRLQQASAANRVRFHLPDGPEQQARDSALAQSGDRSIGNIGWLYDHDASLISPVPNLVFEPAAPPELGIVDDLIRRAFTPYVRAMGREIAPDAYAWFAEAIGKGDIHVARDGGAIVGAICTKPHGRTLELALIGVSPTLQKSGIASWMIGRVEAVARSRGLTALSLYTAEVMEDRVRLYGRHGFTIVRRGPPEHGRDTLTRVYMEKKLQ